MFKKRSVFVKLVILSLIPVLFVQLVGVVLAILIAFNTVPRSANNVLISVAAVLLPGLTCLVVLPIFDKQDSTEKKFNQLI